MKEVYEITNADEYDVTQEKAHLHARFSELMKQFSDEINSILSNIEPEKVNILLQIFTYETCANLIAESYYFFAQGNYLDIPNMFEKNKRFFVDTIVKQYLRISKNKNIH